MEEMREFEKLGGKTILMGTENDRHNYRLYKPAGKYDNRQG